MDKQKEVPASAAYLEWKRLTLATNIPVWVMLYQSSRIDSLILSFPTIFPQNG